jgi:ATP-dependent Lon protease
MSRGSVLFGDEIIISSAVDDDVDFIPLITDEDEDSIKKSHVPEVIPILPLRNTVLFPGVLIPISVTREKSIKLIREVYKESRVIGAVAQKDANNEDPASIDLYNTGTIAYIVKILEMPDGGTTVIIQGRKRFRIEQVVNEKPYLEARINEMFDEKPSKDDKEFEAIVSSLKDLSLKIIRLSTNIPQEASFAVKNIESSSFLINFICSNSNIDTIKKQQLLENNNLKTRAITLMEHLSKEVQMLELKKDIQSKVKTDLDQQQREFMLQQQMKTIQNELGGNPVEKEIEELKKKAKKEKME